jgi:hypothetical protein
LSTPIRDGQSPHNESFTAQVYSLECGQMAGKDPGPVDPIGPEEVRRRLAEAEGRYREASREYAAAVDQHLDDEAVAEAETKKQAARLEYHRMLRIFSDLVIRGKRPKA